LGVGRDDKREREERERERDESLVHTLEMVLRLGAGRALGLPGINMPAVVAHWA
jgi:hypothetical protein